MRTARRDGAARVWNSQTRVASVLAPISGRWLAALDDFRNWLIREAA